MEYPVHLSEAQYKIFYSSSQKSTCRYPFLYMCMQALIAWFQTQAQMRIARINHAALFPTLSMATWGTSTADELSPSCFQNPVKRSPGQPCSTSSCRGGGSAWSACTCTRLCRMARRISPVEEGSCMAQREYQSRVMRWHEAMRLAKFLKQECERCEEYLWGLELKMLGRPTACGNETMVLVGPMTQRIELAAMFCALVARSCVKGMICSASCYFNK